MAAAAAFATPPSRRSRPPIPTPSPSDCPAVLAATQIVRASGQVIYGNTNWRPKDLLGVGPDYPIVRNSQLQGGTFFTERDVTSAAKVCVVGQTVVAKLFQTANPLDQTIRVKNIPFKVIGVLEKKGPTSSARIRTMLCSFPTRP